MSYYFRIRSSILGDSKEVICEGLDRKTLKGGQYGVVGEVCPRLPRKPERCTQGQSELQSAEAAQPEAVGGGGWAGVGGWPWATEAAVWGGEGRLWKEFHTVSITTVCQPRARSCQSPGQ